MTAIIFVNNKRWLDGEPCFDVRFDAQCLPSGSCVCGLITRTARLVQKPHCLSIQEASWTEAIKYSEDVLFGRWQRDEDYPLLP